MGMMKVDNIEYVMMMWSDMSADNALELIALQFKTTIDKVRIGTRKFLSVVYIQCYL